MEFTSLTDKILLIITILGSLATALGTLIGTRNQIKTTDSSVDREKTITPIDASEKLNSISLTIIQTLQTQISNCETEKNEIEKQLRDCQGIDNLARVKLRKLLSKLRTVREKHDRIYYETQSNCPGFEIINQMIDEVILEVEKDLEE